MNDGGCQMKRVIRIGSGLQADVSEVGEIGDVSVDFDHLARDAIDVGNWGAFRNVPNPRRSERSRE